MKIIHVLFFALTVTFTFSCNAQGSQDDQQTQIKESDSDKATVYYFHMTRRCATCEAVENVAKQAVQEMENDKVRFAAYNVEKSEGEKIAKKLGISGQTLLITNGEKQFNITREGFLNARTKPEKLKEIVEQKVTSFQ